MDNSKPLVGHFKGRKTTHLFGGFVYASPLCKQEPWRRLPRLTICFPLADVPITCPKCKKIQETL